MAIVGNAISLITLKALIHVTTKPGATVTFKKGSTTMGTKTANSSGVAELEVLSGDWGSWTIDVSWSASGIATAATGSSSVTISAATTYNVSVTVKWYLIQNGNFCSGFNHTYHATTGTRNEFRDEGDYIWLTTDTQMQYGNSFVSGYFTNGIDMGDWNNMYIDCQAIGGNSYAGIVTDTSAGEASFSNSVLTGGTVKAYTARDTKNLSLSGVTGTKYIALRAQSFAVWDSSGVSGSYGAIKVYNLYLQR